MKSKWSSCILIVQLLFLFNNYSFAQSDRSVADSLIQIYLYQTDTLGIEARLTLLKDISYAEPNPDSSITYAEKLINLAKTEGNSKFEYTAYLLAGNNHAYLGRIFKSIEYYFKAADVAEQAGDKRGLSMAFTSLASSYKKTGNYQLSQDYYQKALPILKELEQYDVMGLAYTNMAYGYYERNLLDSAEYFSLLGIDYLESYFPRGLDYAKGNLALIQLRLNKAGAYGSLLDVIEILKIKEDEFAISDYLSELAAILLDQGKLVEAVIAGEESMVYSKKLGLKEQIRDASKSLCDLYAMQGDFKKALHYQTQYTIYKDSINNIESVNQIANLRTEFEIGQAQAQMDAQQQTQQVINWALIFGLGLLTVFGVAQYRNSRQRMQINQVLRDQKTELEDQKSKLEEVNRTKDRFFSIISHDLRGPVNAFHGVSRMIKFFVQNKQMDQLEVLAEEIDQSVDRLSSLLDNLLNWAVQQQGQFPYVPEKIEIKTMADDLIEVFTTMAKSKQIALNCKVPQGLYVWADRNTTMTILRNLVSNALKFTPREGHVTLTASGDGQSVKIEVNDSGIGIPKDKLGHLFQLNEEASTGVRKERRA